MARGRPTREVARLRDSLEMSLARVSEMADHLGEIHIRLCDALATIDHGRERPVEYPPLVAGKQAADATGITSAA